MKTCVLPGGLFVVICLTLARPIAGVEPPGTYRSPYDVAFSADGSVLAVSDRTAGELVLLDPARGCVTRRVLVGRGAAGVAFASPERALVAVRDEGVVVEVDVVSGKVTRRLSPGPQPIGIAVAPERGLLVTACSVTGEVVITELESGRERARVRVPREPFFLAVTPDEELAVAGNLLPAGSADDPTLAAAVSLIDLSEPATAAAHNITLPAGSTNVREIAVSSAGRRAYVVHTIGRFNVPATQLDRGWINTNALSIVDLTEKSLEATVLLDHPFQGSADPWGTALSPDGSTLWIGLRGVHALLRIDVRTLHGLLAGEGLETVSPDGGSAESPRGIWSEIQRDPSQKQHLANDLSALHVAGVIRRFPLGGLGPRGIALSPDGTRLAVANYYSGDVALVDAASGEERASVSLGAAPDPDPARRGEIAFHDATLCFQSWLSCSTCHPNNGRTDGLRWDLLNDGLGTPQRTRSLVLSHAMRPLTARGVRPGIEVSVPKGLLFLLHEPDEELVAALIAYLESLTPEPSPYLLDGALSASARRGKEIFEGKAHCTRCHTGELGSDMKPHDVGTAHPEFRPDEKFITPKLIEVHRLAPYLHDGRAATLLEVFTEHDSEGKHGDASKLPPAELADLVEYLKSR